MGKGVVRIGCNAISALLYPTLLTLYSPVGVIIVFPLKFSPPFQIKFPLTTRVGSVPNGGQGGQRVSPTPKFVKVALPPTAIRPSASLWLCITSPKVNKL